MNIISPMATGNGAYLVHKILESHLKRYTVVPYHPYLTLFPPVLCGIGRFCKAHLVHTTPDYGKFHIRHDAPLVLTFHNYVLDRFMSAHSNALQNIHYQTDLKWFIKSAIKEATVITAVSHFTSRLVRKELRISTPVKVIHNGIDPAHFFPANHAIGSKKSTINVLFSGNLTNRKGAQWLLPILEKLESKITLQYTLGLRQGYRLPSHDRLECLGPVRYEDMATVYQQADVLLFPTVREGLSLAVTEAMASGLPVVATDCSSLPELIDHGKGGFLCPLGNVQSFTEAINHLAANPVLRLEMGEYNRSKIEQSFTLQRMVTEYKYLFEEVLDTR